MQKQCTLVTAKLFVGIFIMLGLASCAVKTDLGITNVNICKNPYLAGKQSSDSADGMSMNEMLCLTVEELSMLDIQ